MPILASLFRTATPRKFQFPSLRYFTMSWFASRGSRGSRRPFQSDKSVSADKLHPGKSSEQDNSNYLELENGNYFAKSGVIHGSRGVEVL